MSDDRLALRAAAEGSAASVFHELLMEAARFDDLDIVDAAHAWGDTLLTQVTASGLAHTLAYVALRVSRERRPGHG